MKFPIKTFMTRAGWVYAVQYCLPNLLGALPFFGEAVQVARSALYGPLVQMAASLFSVQVPQDLVATGASDGVSEWLTIPVSLALSMAIALVWTLATRNSSIASRGIFESVSRDVVRLFVMKTMWIYGFGKVFGGQFATLNDFRIYSTFAEASPMGLAWRFMGYSAAYQMFGGAAEALGAVLLVWRRTTSAGALVVMGVMTNVVMMNFCFDIPVKLFSSHLLMFAFVLLAPQVKRLMQLLLSDAAIPAFEKTAPFLSTGRWTWIYAFALFGLIVTSTLLVRDRYLQTQSGEVSTIDGTYELAPDGAAALNWKRVSLARNQLFVQTATGQNEFFSAEVDETARHLKVTSLHDPSNTRDLSFSPLAGALRLSGTLNGAPLEVDLKKLDPQTSPLLSRGFHWVQEASYNR
jgi:hypothetical protein